MVFKRRLTIRALMIIVFASAIEFALIIAAEKPWGEYIGLLAVIGAFGIAITLAFLYLPSGWDWFVTWVLATFLLLGFLIPLIFP